MNKTFLSVMILTLSSLYSIRLLPLEDLAVWDIRYVAMDIRYHINWVKQVSDGIREGLIYPRWLPGSNSGYGSPTMVFYSPLYYWLTGVVNLFIPSLVVSLKITIFAAVLLSGLSMYIFLRNFCNHVGSLAGGIAYQLLPYQLFELYLRGALASVFAFLWMPLILHFIYRGIKRDMYTTWLGLAFSYSGLIMTHIVSAYIFTMVMPVYAFIIAFKNKRYRFFLRFMLASFFGLSMSAVYFMPMVFERRFIHVEWLTEPIWADFRNNFLFMKDIITANPLHIINLQMIIVLQIFLVVCLRIYYIKNDNKMMGCQNFIFFYSLFFFSLFMSTPLSAIAWNLIPGLPTIQFPWRWMIVSTLSCSVLIGLVLNKFSFSDIKTDRSIRVLMAIFSAIVIAVFYLSSAYIMSAKPLQRDDMEWILKDGGDVIEHRPIWLSDKKKDFSKEKWVPLAFKKGEGTVDIVGWKSQLRLFKVNALIPSELRVSTFYYPGWTALVNGREIPIEIEKDSGVMLLNIPPGENEVLLEFRDTPLRRGAKWISVVSLLAAFIGLIAAKRNRMALF